MALFGKSKPKKMCPICGEPASRFLPFKWNDEPLCDACGSKLNELSEDARKEVEQSLESIHAYFAEYDERQKQQSGFQSSFQITYQREFGIFFGGCICLDIPQRLLKLSAKNNAFVYEAENIVCFRISEDDAPLFEGNKDELVCYQSDIPDIVKNMEMEVASFRMEQQQYEHMMRMEEEREFHARARGEDYSAPYISAPDVYRLSPFRKYYVYIEVDNPQKKESKEFKEDAPRFNEYDPTVRGYLYSYEKATNDMRILAENLMAVINPDAPQRQVASPTASDARSMPVAQTASADPVAEIQKYKELFDSGAITEEEFAAKKRQLMGI